MAKQNERNRLLQEERLKSEFDLGSSIPAEYRHDD